ncbi:NAD-dependent formate dehydrogenase gamma subunit (fdsG) [Granulibacter bethesdensis]|uniref:NAD-dependent formate dehydrogenase gamma subunit (FdsG) n=2 Tax=Granulibacter bethesdensis TaxID=364410 RepID=A0AAN0RFG2_9PROT|nr:NAD-dependent formate dehydrogenase gamma subunit (fdsG) [Granulibacter bethesdensis]
MSQIMAKDAFSAERAARIIATHREQEGAMLPILHDLQAEFGYVPEEVVPLLADALNVSRAEVHGVISFYHDFKNHPPGRHVLKLCRAEACQAMGANALADHVRERLRVDWHETTVNGALTLEPVFCLGLCACAPAAMLDNELHGRLDQDHVDTLLENVA